MWPSLFFEINKYKKINNLGNGNRKIRDFIEIEWNKIKKNNIKLS
jgi:hypothetical protein